GRGRGDLHRVRHAARGGRGRPRRRGPAAARAGRRDRRGGGRLMSEPRTMWNPTPGAVPPPVAGPQRRPATGPDYEPFCLAVRNLCGIDLLQYKRGQMERRIRSFVVARGISDLTEYATLLRGDRAELEKFLDRVTINVSPLWR